MRPYRDHRFGCFFRRGVSLPLLIFDLIVVVAAIAAYTVNRRFVKPLNITFMRCYFNDMMAGVLFPAYVNILLALIRRRMRGFLPPLLCTFAAACFWEYITPLYRPRSVSDPWDIAAYLAGTLIYCFIDRSATAKWCRKPEKPSSGDRPAPES